MFSNRHRERHIAFSNIGHVHDSTNLLAVLPRRVNVRRRARLENQTSNIRGRFVCDLRLLLLTQTSLAVCPLLVRGCGNVLDDNLDCDRGGCHIAGPQISQLESSAQGMVNDGREERQRGSIAKLTYHQICCSGLAYLALRAQK